MWLKRGGVGRVEGGGVNGMIGREEDMWYNEDGVCRGERKRRKNIGMREKGGCVA